MEFKENESFLHKAAKELLYKELLIAEEKEINFNVFSWRKNYGVFLELPFFETDDPYYFECSKCLLRDKNDSLFEERIKENSQSVFNNTDRGSILFVPDICIFHKGIPIYFIEVVHKNATTDFKLNKIKSFFKGDRLQVYEVSAYQIMAQTTSLENINFNLILET